MYIKTVSQLLPSANEVAYEGNVDSVVYVHQTVILSTGIQSSQVKITPSPSGRSTSLYRAFLPLPPPPPTPDMECPASGI